MNSVLIAFTSACGGVGTSSLAICFSRILSRLYEKNVMYLSFDWLSEKGLGEGPCSRKLIFEAHNNEEKGLKAVLGSAKTDDYGVHFLGSSELVNPIYILSDRIFQAFKAFSDEYEFIVADCPAGCELGRKVIEFSDYIVINEGFADYSGPYCEALYESFSEIFEGAKLVRFGFSEDKDSVSDGEIDIHGQFGAEVRALAEQIAG